MENDSSEPPSAVRIKAIVNHTRFPHRALYCLSREQASQNVAKHDNPNVKGLVALHDASEVPHSVRVRIRVRVRISVRVRMPHRCFYAATPPINYVDNR